MVLSMRFFKTVSKPLLMNNGICFPDRPSFKIIIFTKVLLENASFTHTYTMVR